MSKKYRATDLFTLMVEVAEEVASSENVTTLYHAFYAIAKILTMKQETVLEEVGGEEEKNKRVSISLNLCGSVTATIESRGANLSGVVAAFPCFLEAVEQLEQINQLHENYKKALNEWDYGKYSEEFPVDCYTLDLDSRFYWFYYILVNNTFSEKKNEEKSESQKTFKLEGYFYKS